jgi:hypothetical protein
MPRFLTSLEDNALSLVFELVGQSRYNRTLEEYGQIASRLPPLKQLEYEVNKLLKRKLESGGIRGEICRFRAGDKIIK